MANIEIAEQYKDLESPINTFLRNKEKKLLQEALIELCIEKSQSLEDLYEEKIKAIRARRIIAGTSGFVFALSLQTEIIPNEFKALGLIVMAMAASGSFLNNYMLDQKIKDQLPK